VDAYFIEVHEWLADENMQTASPSSSCKEGIKP
jgi:hypothetical protein